MSKSPLHFERMTTEQLEEEIRVTRRYWVDFPELRPRTERWGKILVEELAKRQVNS
jgi:hypothetical protein